MVRLVPVHSQCNVRRKRGVKSQEVVMNFPTFFSLVFSGQAFKSAAVPLPVG